MLPQMQQLSTEEVGGFRLGIRDVKELRLSQSILSTLYIHTHTPIVVT